VHRERPKTQSRPCVRSLRGHGLVPSDRERQALRGALAAALPDARLDYRVNTLSQTATSATDRLERWTRTNVAFFGDGATPRDESEAEATLAEAASLLLTTPTRVQMRVVGYADTFGSRSFNERLTRRRASSRRFCRMVGGDITAESSLGKGATFTIEIPAEADRPVT